MRLEIFRLPAIAQVPLLTRLRDSYAPAIDFMWFALAVVLGLALATWLTATLGLPSPLAPVENLLVL
jgi:hypothetical protein